MSINDLFRMDGQIASAIAFLLSDAASGIMLMMVDAGYSAA